MGLSVVSPTVWSTFIGGFFVLILLDLFLLARKSKGEPKEPTMKSALLQTGFWVSVALLYNWWFWHHYGHDLGLQFLTGYLVEKSLSIDNLFVILLVFKSFSVPVKYQHRVLFWGIFGAVIMRGILIVLGASLLHQFHFIIYVFGVILIASGVKFLVGSDEISDVKDHWMVRLCRRFIPITGGLRGQKFFIKEKGVLMATPLLLALLVVEVTDLIFAVDSIPAVLAVTKDAFVAFASNILAVLGLRALYFVIAEWVGKLRYLKPGLAAVLCFVGIKMLLTDLFKIPSIYSLIVIVFILLTAGLSSWYVNRVEERKG
jgi:tellurite resistance protein TerC